MVSSFVSVQENFCEARTASRGSPRRGAFSVRPLGGSVGLVSHLVIGYMSYINT